jgi:hypothetical protein
MGDGKFCPSCGTLAGSVVPAQAPPPQAAQPSATEKVGNIRKCPACGAEVPAMTAVCPSCGNEFSNVKVASSVQQFFEKLDALDQKIYDTSSDKPNIAGALLGMYGLGGTQKGDKAKINLIESFPIPNSREDIVEFMILASSRINYSGVNMMGNVNYMTESRELAKYNNAWKSKIKQAHTKAKVVFANDKEAMAQIIPILNEFNAAEKKARIKRTIIIAIVVIAVVVFYGGLGILGR